MAGPIQVEVTRGGVVEAVHTVHAVAVRDGRIVAEAGDPRLVTFLRSSAKPLQVLPLVRTRPDLADREIAIACASHLSRPEQLDAVRTLLGKAGASEADLETGAVPPIDHTCSGKHAGFLAVCKDSGFETQGYRLASHPLQRGAARGDRRRGGRRPRIGRRRERRVRRSNLRAPARPLRPRVRCNCPDSTGVRA